MEITVKLYLDEDYHTLSAETKTGVNTFAIKLTAQAETLLRRAILANKQGEDADCFLIATGTEFTSFGKKDYGKII